MGKKGKKTSLCGGRDLLPDSRTQAMLLDSSKSTGVYMQRDDPRKRERPKRPRHDVKVGEPIEEDEAVGGWSRLDYETMDTRFRNALVRSMKQGQ
jgi:hypothetical protein